MNLTFPPQNSRVDFKILVDIYTWGRSVVCMGSLRNHPDSELSPPPLTADKVAAVMYLDFFGKLAELPWHCSLVMWAAPTLTHTNSV